MTLTIEDAEAVVLVSTQPGPERGPQLSQLDRPKDSGCIPFTPC